MLPRFPAGKGTREIGSKRKGKRGKEEFLKGKCNQAREWLSREDSASPTSALESIFLTSIIDAKEERDVMSVDVPNAFI